MKQIYSSCIPLVKAGKSEPITVSQTLDGRLKQDGPATVHVRIDGPQTALLADMIAGVYPSPGSDTSPDEFLPHIALSRRTLPWERTGPNADAATPWLALLLFRESELRSPAQRKQAPTVSVSKLRVQSIQDLKTRTRLMTTLQISPETEVSTLTVANSLLSQIMPQESELPLLCHMKRETIGGADVDHAIVVCNRLPDAAAAAGQKPELHTAVLVSVEQASELFPPPAAGSTTLIVLHHWTFRPSQGGDFEQVIKSIAYRPHGGVLRFGNLPAPVTAGETAPLSGGFKGLIDRDAYFLTPVEHDQDVNATYRSPLHPFAPAPRSPGFAIAPAPDEFENADQTTPLDFSHAAAFELGRLLALNDPGILEDLRHVKGTLKPLDVPDLVNPLPDVLQKPDWVVNPAWAERPWDSALGQNLVKDQSLFFDKGVGDITGIRDHLGQWDVGAVVSTLNSIGPAVTTPVTGLNIGTVTAATLEEQFADVAQAAKA
ncbi:MAG: hypothetical protein R3C19_07285 [Planctomycetaceae bacterium]